MCAGPSQEAGIGGQHVVYCKRPDGEALGNLYVKATPRCHGKVGLGSAHFSRYLHAGPGEKRIMGCDHGQFGRVGTRHYAQLTC